MSATVLNWVESVKQSVLFTERTLDKTVVNLSNFVSPILVLIASAVLCSNALKVSRYRPASSLLHAKIMQKSRTTDTRVSSRRVLHSVSTFWPAVQQRPSKLTGDAVMFAIENEQTRKSLKSAFENIFAKYGRDFAEDDEVDLGSMEVTKPGGHLARLKSVAFGRAFKDRQHSFDKEFEHKAPLEIDEDVFETDRRKNRPTADPVQVAQIRYSFNYAVASKVKKPRDQNCPDDPPSFHSILLDIRQSQKDRARQYPITHERNCFDSPEVGLEPTALRLKASRSTD
ncbi:hypothetical protein PSACC_03309 [Paramicrosporidium saccamoebae]|uniref:Uncharacterized protein n=1 Tax=Paramicrosporidium saccamoebae TaxID=1246581 RepID=A0A2H9TGP9_9FUNG|nr:hypothetical protein PSACC_03309 [Paramicrosporidium saccamoebae]